MPDKYKDLLDKYNLLKEENEKCKKDSLVNINWEVIFDAIPHPTIILDKNHKIIEANKALVKASNLSLEQIKGANCFKIFHSQDSKFPPLGCPSQKLFHGKIKETVESVQDCFNGVCKVSCTPVFNKNGDLENIIHINTDITDLKLYEKQLKDSETKFKNIVKSSTLGIYLYEVDEKGELILKEANYAADKILGIDHSNLINKPITEAFPALIETDIPFNYKKVAVNGTAWHNDFCEIKAYNSIFSISAFQTEQNKMCVIFSDITEKKKIEEKLIINEKNLKNFFNTINEFLFIIDLSGNIIDINKTVINKLHYLKEELINKPVINIHPKNLQEKAKEIMADMINGKTDTCFLPIIDAFGKIIPVETYVVKGLWNNEPVYYGISKDVSELKKSEEKFSKAFHRNPTLIGISELETGIYIDVNNAFCEKIGYLASEIIGKPSYEIIKFDRETRKRLFVKLKEQGYLNNEEALIHDRNNNEIYVLLSAEIIELDNKLYNYTIAIDISERKIVEKALVEAKERAEESDKLKSAFLANMSHEIRTPMNGILGFASLIKENDPPKDKLKQYIEIIENSGKRMLNIINDLIDISKIESGQMKVNYSATNINEHINNLYSFFLPEVEKKDMKLIKKITLSDKDSTINTDNEKVYAILTNLIKNSVKYSEHGTITYGYKEKGENLLFYVKDTGIGIPQDKLNSIFERFIQADMNSTKHYEGAGLGLAISKAYVEMLNGKIWVESEENKGSTFYFTLPYSNTEQKAKNDNSIEIKSLINKKLNVLIVEDDKLSYLYLKEIVQEFSATIYNAYDGLEAVEIVKNNNNIDLILMDIKMPKIDGYETTRRIREINNEVIIIAQTAFALEGDNKKAIKAGCNAYLSKPVSKKDLFSLVNILFKE